MHDQEDGLIKWSIDRLPEQLEDAFIKSQKLSLKHKWKKHIQL